MQTGWLLRGLLVGVVAGVAGASFFVWPGMAWVLIAVGVSVVAVWQTSWRGWFVAILCFGAACGWWRTETVRETWDIAGKDTTVSVVTGEARVVGESSKQDFSQSVPVIFEKCEGNACPTVKVLAQVPLVERWQFGDRMKVTCPLVMPKSTGAQFDYRMYLTKEGIGFMCRPKIVKRLERQLSWQDEIFLKREMLEKSLAAVVPEPENGLLAGIVFGGSGRLSKETRDNFARVGLSHIVAVSGQNVALVGEYLLLGLIGIGLWRQQAFWVVLVMIWIFVMATGMEASAVRAGIMGTLGFVGLHTGRLVRGEWLIVMAAAGMLMVNPLLLRYDVGFQLSFLATVALVCMLGMRRNTSTETFFGSMKDILLATVVIEIVTIPLLLKTFGFVSVVALVANVLVLLFIPMAMGLTFITSVAGLVFPAYINVFGWLAYGIGWWIIEVAKVLSRLSWATATFTLSAWGVVAWYGGVVGAWWLWKKKI